MVIKDIFKNMKYVIILPARYEKTLYWLHGYNESIESILEKSKLKFCAEKYHIAIILPHIPSDTYYLNQPWRECYAEDFLTYEFIPHVCEKYKFSDSRENTFIAGASMGGFGSMLIGSHRPDLFGKIVAVSGAFIIDDILINNPEVTFNNIEHFQKLFGDIHSLENSVERNPLRAAIYALEQGKLPPILITCGTKDMLYKRNQKLYQRLTKVGADVTWIEVNYGNHDWNFVNSILEKVFEWMI